MAVTSALVDNATRTGSNGTTSTITGAAFGTAFAGRVLVVAWASFSVGLDPTACTIGGVSATIVKITGSGQGLASAVVPTGTSGNIVFTYASADTAVSNGVVALTGAANATPSATIAVLSSSSTINVGAGGSLVAFALAGSAGTWTGATGLRTDTSLGATLSTASFDNSGGAITGRTVSYSGGLGLVAAAFTAAGGGGTGVGSSSGAGAAVGVGQASVSAVGSSAGAGVAAGVGRAAVAAVGSTAGAGAATAVGQAGITAVASAAGAGVATGIGQAAAVAIGASAGAGVASGVGAATAASVGSAAGSGAASGVGRATAAAVGSSAGAGTASAVSGAASVGMAAGAGTATGVGQAIINAVGTAAGAGAATGIAPVIVSAVGQASGAATVTGRSGINPANILPSGSYPPNRKQPDYGREIREQRKRDRDALRAMLDTGATAAPAREDKSEPLGIPHPEYRPPDPARIAEVAAVLGAEERRKLRLRMDDEFILENLELL